MIVKILTHTPDAEKIIAAAAKLCYSASDIDSVMDKLDEETTLNFLGMLDSLGHSSPFEHVSYTFGIEGVSRSLLAQLTRHRIASFSVQSQRYVNKKDFNYIIPPEIENIPEAKAEFLKAMEEDREHYIKLASILYEASLKKTENENPEKQLSAAEKKAAEKKAFEDARSVLPNACDTKIIMTMNVRSLWNFFELRCCNRAQWEIRELADEMLRQLKEMSPALFAKAGPSCVNGVCREGKMSCGKAEEVRLKWSK